MNNASFEFNKQLELDVLLNGLTEISEKYVDNRSQRQVIDEIVIPRGITHIKDEAFVYFKGLVKVTLSDTVIDIGHEAFEYCEDPKDITIPDGVTTIGEYTFYYCTSLTNVSIPASVTSIGCGAFYKCKGLTNLTFKGKTLAEVKAMEGFPWGISPEKVIAQDAYWEFIIQ